MALILNIETSTEVCSVNLSENGKLLFEKESSEGLNHSKLLTVFIEDLFVENQFSFNKLDAVAVSKGPGSYTGLRIGVSVAKGLCYALNIPLIGVNSLETIGNYTAQNVAEYFDQSNKKTLFCPMIDARRMEVYNALFDSKGNTINKINAKIIDEKSFENELNTHQILFFGNGAEKCKPILTHENAIFKGPKKTSARFMQNIAQEKYNKQLFEDLAYFEPFYLKNFIATIPKNKII